MTVTEPEDQVQTYRYWPYRGCSLDELADCEAREGVLPALTPDSVIARVEAVSICSSDVKIVRLGTEHPLFSADRKGAETVLGHEVSLRVHAVGETQRQRFRPGQRLGLQPAMRIDGRRQIVGMDVPGGFAQYLRLGPEVLASYVFEVPETLAAAEIAMLEPYGCVERAYRPNCRQDLDPAGRALFVLGPGADTFRTSRKLEWSEVALVDDQDAPLPSYLAGLPVRRTALSHLGDEQFDDIVALGELDAETLAALPPRLAEGGLLLQARRTATGPVPIDPVRAHYDALAFVGTTSADFSDALQPDTQRFDVKPGGVALIHGAGGAMGRIHVHRLLELERGPGTVIATSRKGPRLEDLERDFAPLAEAHGRRLVVRESAELNAVVAEEAPGGLDDAVVVAPDVDAVAAAAAALAPDGLLAVFAGFPYGQLVPFDLSAVAVSGKRLTGSTGCSVADMQDVLNRAVSGKLDLTANVRAVAGLDALPEALSAVSRGAVSGKIVVYPQCPTKPLQRLERRWTREDEAGLT